MKKKVQITQSGSGNLSFSPLIKLARFLVGLGLLSLTVAAFASGYAPPGVLGEVLRHNQIREIDASPLFYSEVENMADLEKGVAGMLARAKLDSEFEPDDQRPGDCPAGLPVSTSE